MSKAKDEYYNSPPEMNAIRAYSYIKELEAIRDKKCKWAYDNIDSNYIAGCGEVVHFFKCNLKDNGIKFCPFCGGRIEEK